jgi:Rrf2 family transcriptional regulator, iron-sulfur cluster assembly transcription factor
MRGAPPFPAIATARVIPFKGLKMIRCGKTAQTAIAAASLLAERYDGGETVLSSLEISKQRNISLPLVAKLLSTLSTAGIIDGTRGPGGGYWLARPPAEISLQDIVTAFEKEHDMIMCPFGPDWCGNNEPCPMHDDLVAMDQQWSAYLQDTHLGIFQRKTSARRGK